MNFLVKILDKRLLRYYICTVKQIQNKHYRVCKSILMVKRWICDKLKQLVK